MSLAYAPMEIAAMTEPKRLAIALPEHERGRSEDHVRRLEILNRRLAKPLPKGDRKAEKAREADLAERDALEALPAVKADQRWQREALAETEALAAQRGEAITEDRAGVRRIMDRDPLLSLARSGHITPDQLEVGQRVRELYDSRASDAGAMEYSGMPGAGHDHEKFVANRFSRAKVSAMVVRIEMAVHADGGEAGTVVLRTICMYGRSMNTQGEGRAYKRNCIKFARAMDVADLVLRRQI